MDSSQEAIDTCWENAQLNQVSDDKIDLIRSDIAAFLQQKDEEVLDDSSDKYYDVIILDPPKFAPSAKALDKAQRKYHSFNREEQGNSKQSS